MHPFVKIIYFVLALFLISVLSNQLLCLLLVLISVLAATLHLQSFLHTIKRMRWLFFSVLIIYAFATPGQLIPNIPVNFSPTFEGVEQGLLQIVKLSIAVGALSLLYATSSKEQLILGLYMLLKPLKYLGLNIEKFAVRLFLTLEYVENLANKQHRKFSFEQFDAIYLTTEAFPVNSTVTFESRPFNKIDKLMIAIAALIFLGLFVRTLPALGPGA